MVGNAVPVKFATMLALQIYAYLRGHMPNPCYADEEKVWGSYFNSQAPVKVAA